MALETLKDVKEIGGYKLYDIDEASRLATLGDDEKKSNPRQFDQGSANSSLGMMFVEQFCEKCKHDHYYHNACILYINAMTGEPPAEHIYNEDGMPVCTKFELDDDLENRWTDKFIDVTKKADKK